MGFVWRSPRGPLPGWAGAAALLLVALAWWAGAAWINPSANNAVPLPEADVCVVAPPTPYDPASGLALNAARPVPADARCPVCGMYPARSPDWAAQVIFANGDAQFFDTPVSLLLYLSDVARYSPGRSAGDIVARYVTDVPSRGWISAESAFYVHGSSARGPMRAGNLPAFASAAAAQQFADQRGGVVQPWDGIDPAEVQRMGGQAHTDH